MELTKKEQDAISEFIQDNWDKFKETAIRHLGIQEVDELGDRLSKE